MSVRVTGVLTDAGGNIAPNVHIQFTTTQGFGSTLPTAPLDVITGADGGYDFNLVIGTHRISIRYGDRFEPIGTTVINDETPGVLTLSELLKQTAPVTPEALKLIMQYTAEAKAAKEEAGQFTAQAEENAAQSLVEATKSKQHADQSKIYRDQTAAIATGGTATLEPEPGKIPLADQHGHIDDGWLNAATFARSESDMMADRARNNQLFAASGHIHAGKHRNDVNPVYGRPIQDGLWTYLNNSNVLRLGAYKELSNVEGDSKTYESVFNMAGVTVHLKGLNSAYENAQLILPPAPKGTEVYDSATGVLTNFETEIDPKYGDVAADTNEAVARAFEGIAKNGDFRLGSSFWTSASGRGTMSVNDGKCTLTDTTNAGIGGSANWSSPEGLGLTEGVTYIIELLVDSLVNDAAAWVRLGHYQDPEQRNEPLKVGYNRFEFTAGLSGAEQGVIIYSGKLGTLVFSSLSCRKKAAEVVTNPVDLVGLEVFLRPITETDPFIYPYGMQQSKLTSIDGIPTVENNVRPITHFEVYPGDTSSRGRGWSLFDGSLTDAQKAKVFQNPEHNIYRMSDGTIVQWTVSQRTIRGLKNGDWLNVNSISSSTLARANTASAVVTARGSSDLPVNARYLDAVKNTNNVLKNNGVFTARNASDIAYNGECYFYVIATVPRLNQGAYHPEWNPTGTASGWKNNGSGRAPWHDSLITQFVSPASCFKSSNDSSGADGGYDPTTGKLGGRTDRPDGLLHDVIYASGLNGVIDHRPKYGAWNASSSEQAAVVREEVKNGTYRGRERLIMTRITQGDAAGSNGTTFGIYVSSDRIQIYSNSNYLSQFALGDKVHIYHSGLGLIYTGLVTTIRADNVWVTNATETTGGWTGFGSAANDASMVYVIHESPNGNTVEGEFTQTDVIGDPVNILLTDALKDGWLGSWIPVIPDGVLNYWDITRKASATNASRLYTSDYGSTWSYNASVTIDTVLNQINYFVSPVGIYVINYTAFAKQTEPSSNLPIFNGESGLSSVFHSSHNAINLGCLLSESAFNNVFKGASNYLLGNATLQNMGAVDSSGKLLTTSGLLPTHSELNQYGTGTENNSPGGKFLFHQIDESGQANLNIIANELIYSSTGGNWGDDAKLKIVADGTFTNLNGNKCKAAIHKLVKSYGFIKM